MLKITDECLQCKDVKNKQQLMSCWKFLTKGIDSILYKVDYKIDNLIKTIDKNNHGHYKPDFYIDVRLRDVNIDYCNYEYIEERILKYYFFVQKDLAHFFYEWKKLYYHDATQFSFGTLHNQKIFGRIAQHPDFIYLRTIWSFSNHYKHASETSAHQLSVAIKQMECCAKEELNFTTVVKKALTLIENDLHKY